MYFQEAKQHLATNDQTEKLSAIIDQYFPAINDDIVEKLIVQLVIKF